MQCQDCTLVDKTASLLPLSVDVDDWGEDGREPPDQRPLELQSSGFCAFIYLCSPGDSERGVDVLPSDTYTKGHHDNPEVISHAP